MSIHGPPEDSRQRVGGRRTGPEDLSRHTRPHERVWVRGRLGEGLTAGSHTAGVTGPLWSDVVRGTTRHKWDKRQRIKDQHGEHEIQFADVDDHNVVTNRVHPSPPGGCLQGFGQKFWSVCSFHLAHCVALAAWPLPEARVALSLARSSAP